MLYKPRQVVKVSNLGDGYWWFNAHSWTNRVTNEMLRKRTDKEPIKTQEKVEVDRSHLKDTG